MNRLPPIAIAVIIALPIAIASLAHAKWTKEKTELPSVHMALPAQPIYGDTRSTKAQVTPHVFFLTPQGQMAALQCKIQFDGEFDKPDETE